ncbi:MAG TPA: hypothetical protein PK014_06835 [Thermoanaerobaculia bacterium]|nr:hypothetical protein [Thermoanaerobaculia bacterium]HUM29845.1 hypothetical protein [Thermoanaerobaculia bacterium]HXK68120.1 hypothetical protein [Thermoanaerobaculia bacterium]
MISLILWALLFFPTLDAQQVQSRITEIRGLPFKHSVTVKSMDREALDPFIQRALKDTYGDHVEGLERWLKALRLIPENTDMVADLLNLYKSQVAAFYDPKDQVYYVIRGVGDEGMVADMVALHEFTHALQDQYMNLDSRMTRLMGNHDAQMALQSVLEGEATILMMADQFGKLGGGDLRAFSDSLDLFAPTMTDIMGDFPPYLIHEMVFPYLQGARFVIEKTDGGKNFKALDQWYASPPCSTEAILHPNQKTSFPADFSRMINKTAPGSWDLTFGDTLGESTWSYIFHTTGDKERAERAAAGWDGDRVGLFTRGKNEVTVWLSRWDSRSDREEAESALKDYLKMSELPFEILSGENVFVAVTGEPGDRRGFIKKITRRLKQMEEVHGYDCASE